ncbi:MAG TPA: hypothetical protein VIJ35_13725 [Bradyrhizobium sp.]
MLHHLCQDVTRLVTENTLMPGAPSTPKPAAIHCSRETLGAVA